MQKRGPVFLLTFLFLILMFIVGVRYGQHVEQANKQINALLSIPPTKAAPTTGPVGFKTYAHQGCGVQFLYPNSVFVSEEASQSARLTQNETIAVSFSCEKTDPFLLDLKTQKVSTEEALFQNKKIPVQLVKTGGATVEYFSLLNSITGKTVYFAVDKAFYPLLESSLKFFLPKPTSVPK